jgi:hypothetical protein
MALGGFERPAGANPVIGPLPGTKILLSLSKREVNWEESDTFNPAAVVKGDNIFVLYRGKITPGLVSVSGHHASDWQRARME